MSLLYPLDDGAPRRLSRASGMEALDLIGWPDLAPLERFQQSSTFFGSATFSNY
jgi:hypothetical protein